METTSNIGALHGSADFDLNSSGEAQSQAEQEDCQSFTDWELDADLLAQKLEEYQNRPTGSSSSEGGVEASGDTDAYMSTSTDICRDTTLKRQRSISDLRSRYLDQETAGGVAGPGPTEGSKCSAPKEDELGARQTDEANPVLSKSSRSDQELRSSDQQEVPESQLESKENPTPVPAASKQISTGSCVTVCRNRNGCQWSNSLSHDYFPHIKSDDTDAAAKDSVQATSKRPDHSTTMHSDTIELSEIATRRQEHHEGGGAASNSASLLHPTARLPKYPCRGRSVHFSETTTAAAAADNLVNNPTATTPQPKAHQSSSCSPSSLLGQQQPPPKAYPLSPAVPTLGGTPAQLDLLAQLSIPDDQAATLDDVLRAHTLDPAGVREADRKLLFALLHAQRTEGLETSGFDVGADARGGALRFVDLRPGGSGEGGGAGGAAVVDVTVWAFLRWLRYGDDGGEGKEDDYQEKKGREEEERGADDKEGDKVIKKCSSTSSSLRHTPTPPPPPPPPPPGKKRTSSPPLFMLLDEGSDPLTETADSKKWTLLLRKLEHHALSLSDVSEAQIEEWRATPLVGAAEYFEMHLRDVLRRKKAKKASRKTEEQSARELAETSGLSAEERVRWHRARAYGLMTGSWVSEGARVEGGGGSGGGDHGAFAPANDEDNLMRIRMGRRGRFAHRKSKGKEPQQRGETGGVLQSTVDGLRTDGFPRRDVEVGKKNEDQQAGVWTWKIKVGKCVKWTVSIVLALVVVLGVIFGAMVHHKAAQNRGGKY